MCVLNEVANYWNTYINESLLLRLISTNRSQIWRTEWLNAMESRRSPRGAVVQVAEYLWKIFKSGKSKMNNSRRWREIVGHQRFLLSPVSKVSVGCLGGRTANARPSTNAHVFQYIKSRPAKRNAILSTVIHNHIRRSNILYIYILFLSLMIRCRAFPWICIMVSCVQRNNVACVINTRLN